jgi:hypothetical protein
MISRSRRLSDPVIRRKEELRQKAKEQLNNIKVLVAFMYIAITYHRDIVGHFNFILIESC